MAQQVRVATLPDDPPAPQRRRLKLWREALYVLGVYLVYSTVRNRFGSAGGEPGHANGIAFGHALDIIRIQDALRLYIERSIQLWYLGLPGHGFIQVWNIFYGTAHFIVTGGALAWLFFRDPARYPRWRNTLAATTLLALIGFATFSLMPPRLLDEPVSRYGPPAGSQLPAHSDFEDTLAEYPTFWSFDSGGLKNISNQYAAMPSLHTAWSTWSALVLLPLVRRRWLKALVVLHPLATVFCIIVTGNHFWLDAVGGLFVLGAGYLLAWRATTYWERRNGVTPRPAPS
jgi:hypothetical protein